MAETKKKAKGLLSRAEGVLDVAQGTLNNLPNITLYGTSLVEIDNFRSLLDFSEGSVRVNTTDGIVRLDGIALHLAYMTDESIAVKGSIKNLSFE
ncbi:MAG: YabP/YqfC family sporulation protein [Clostridia bacterium]|nr:YabP/YqfC family sporulation protein [Clostridia bacterium]